VTRSTRPIRTSVELAVTVCPILWMMEAKVRGRYSIEVFFSGDFSGGCVGQPGRYLVCRGDNRVSPNVRSLTSDLIERV
jgi:hypothetical protein